MSNDSVFSNTINQVKGLAILLVVLGHIASPLGVTIFSFHIPLFFFLGGVFIKTTYPTRDFLKKNFIRLIAPYLIFGALGLLVNDVKNFLLHRPMEDFLQSVIGLLFWMDAQHLQHYGLVLWFLPALFWARIIAYFLIKYMGDHVWWGFSLCVMCAYVFSSMMLTILPFGLDKGLVAVPWLFMGFIFNQHKERILTASRWYVMLGVLAIFLIVYFDRMPRLDMAAKNLDHIFLALPYTFLVIILIVYFAYNGNVSASVPLKISRAFTILGSQSMLIYIVHPYTNNGAYLLVTYFLGEGYWYLKFAATIVMLLAVIQIKLSHQNFPLFKYL